MSETPRLKNPNFKKRMEGKGGRQFGVLGRVRVSHTMAGGSMCEGIKEVLVRARGMYLKKKAQEKKVLGEFPKRRARHAFGGMNPC